MNVGILGSLAILVFGVAFFYIGFIRIKKNTELQKFGVRTKALITEIIRNHMDDNNTSSYRVSVAFNDVDGNEIEGELPFSPGVEYTKVHPENSYIDVIYLKEKPTVFTTTDGDFTDGLSVLFIFVSALLFFLSIFVLYQSILNP